MTKHFSVVFSTEQSDAQLPGLQKALEGQSHDDTIPLSPVLPLISRSCRVHHLHSLDVSATKCTVSNDCDSQQHMYPHRVSLQGVCEPQTPTAF